MKKDEYLYILSDRLRVLPVEEYNDIMEYYKEYFEEAGVENEENVINELGDVEALAKKIINENMPLGDAQNGMYIRSEVSYVQNGQQYTEYQQTSQGVPTSLKVIIIILGLPILIGIASAIVGLVVGFGVAFIAGLVAGICCIGVGFMTLSSSAATFVMLIGGGLITIAISLGFLMATVGIIQLSVKLIKAMFGKKSEQVLEKSIFDKR